MRTLVSGAWFALGVAVTFMSTAAIDVYLLGHFERVKGPNTTFLIIAWLTPVVALVTGAAYVVGAKARAFSPSGRASFIAGVLISLLFWLLPHVGRILPDSILIVVTWLACLGGSFFAPAIIRRLHAHGSEPANP